MNEFWNLILVSFFATNSLEKAESVQLEEAPLKIIDEIFGEGWWGKDKAEEWDKLTLEQNAFHQIDRQNTQFGQIEPNSTDQNLPLTESDHFNNAKNAVVKELGLCLATIYNWKRELGQITLQHKHTHSEQKTIMKRYYEIKNKTPNIYDKDIAKMLKIGRRTLSNWKKQFKQQQLHQNSVDENSVEGNAVANVQEF
uniref:Uncharacterized protein n=1 Tax=Globodera rostochiensis TaxID=31243 RepID=A0A914HNU1_GLORO